MTNVLDYYEINERTLCLIPIEVKDSKRHFTLVMESEKEYIVKKVPMTIIKHSMKYHGENYKTMRSLVKKVLWKQRKLPFLISKRNRIIMFPTSATRNVKHCYYISSRHIIEMIEDPEGTQILFYNGKSIKVRNSIKTVKTMRQKTYSVLGHR